MDLTIGLRVDVSQFKKEWEATYRKQVQDVIGAKPVSLKVNVPDLKNVTAEVDKLKASMSGIYKTSGTIGAVQNPLRAVSAGYRQVSKDAIAAAKAQEKFSTLVFRSKIEQMYPTRKDGALAAMKSYYTELEKASNAQQRATRHANEYNAALRTQRGILNGMPQFLNAYVSVLGATRLVDNIRRITAEFELQRVSLAAILRDKAAADQLFEQTLALAIESPFTSKELVTYTKQLAAYRIEQDKLFDTTKMLADVSAGLGVSMDRLILAYGQVRAAAVLRGTEVRQFTEAGIPLIEMLAEKYTELEGRIVSTAEVFDRISTRKVPFEDVADIFEDMTSKGGMFYDMQRKQSETLYGIYQKLGDQLQISFAQIGGDNQGALRAAGEVALKFAENLDTIIEVLTKAGLAWGAYTVSQRLYTQLTKSEADAILNTVKAEKLREASALRLKSVLTGLSAEEKARVATARQMTVEDVKALAANKGYTAEMGARLVATKQISKAVALQAAAELKLSEAQISQLAGMGKFRVSLKLLRAGIMNVVSSVKALSVALLTNPFTWVLAAVQGVTMLFNKMREVDEQAKALRETFLDQAESLEASYQKAQTTIEKSKGSLDVEIVAYKTLLKKNQDLYPLVVKRLEKVTDEAEQLEILKKSYEDLYNILNDEMSGKAFATAVDNAERWNRSFTKDMNDVANSFDKILSKTAKLSQDPDVDSKMYREYMVQIKQLREAFNEGEISIDSLIAKLNTLAVSAPEWKIADRVRELASDLRQARGVLQNFGYELQAQLQSIHPEWDFSDLTEEQFQTLQNEVQVLVSSGLTQMEELGPAGRAMVQRYVQDLYKIVLASNDAIKDTQPEHEPETPEGLTPADMLKSELDVIKKAYDQYKKLRDVVGSGEASKQVSEAFKELFDAFQYMPTDTKVPTSISEYIAVLEQAMNSAAADYKLRLNIKTEISENTVKNLVEQMKEALDKAKEQIQQSKAASDFYEGLLATGMSEPVAWQMTMNLYGANPMDIRDQMVRNLREAFKQKLNVNMPLNLADAERMIKENADNIGTETANMLQSLLNDLRNYDTETIKSLQSNLSETATIEAKRVKIYRDAAKQIQQVQALAIPEPQRTAMMQEIEKRKQEQLASLGWEEFKSGGLYTTLFSDLDKVSSAALSRMRDKLSEVKEQLKGLPANQLKEVMSAITKVEKELVERDPFSAITQNIGSLITGYRDLRIAEDEYMNAQESADAYSQSLNTALAERLTLEQQLQEARRTGEDTSELQQQLVDKEFEIERLRAQLAAAQKAADAKRLKANEVQGSISDLESGLKETSNIIGNIQNGFSEVRDLVETVGVELEDTTLGAMFDGVDAGLKSLQSVVSIMQTIQTLQRLFQTSSIMGWATLAVSAVAGVISAITSSKVNRIQSDIEALEAQVHSLERAYERLSDVVERALGSDLIKATTEQMKNLRAQAEAYAKMARLESQKGKKSDADKIQEYQEQYEDLMVQVRELKEELVNTLAGTDLKSLAVDVATAWIDAYASFAETTDAIKEKFSDLVQNLIIQSIAARVVQNLLDPVYKAIDEATSATSLGGTDVVEKEIAGIAAMFPTIIGQIDSSLTGLMESLKQEGVDIRQGETNLTGISAAAAGITEDTALTLGAIGNNLVYYVVSIHDLLAAKFATEGVGTDSTAPTLLSVQQAALTELRAIQNNTARSALAAEQLASALSSVISPLGVKSGAKAINVNL